MQLLILADVLLESVGNSSNGPIMLPVKMMTARQRENVSNLVESHLGTLLDTFEKIKPRK